METKRMWRCTRNYPYDNPNCIGHTDTKCRQGHYIEAETREEALKQMIKDFPQDIGFGFTVEDWTDR